LKLNITFIIIVVFSIQASAQKKWSLDECISHAKAHNIDIRKQQFQNSSTQEDITIAKGNYFPSISFNASQGYNLGNSFNVSTGVGQLESRFNSFSLSASVLIFNGFSNRYQLQQARLNSEKGDLDIEKLRLDLALNVANKYLQVLFNKEILSVAEEQKIISTAEVDRLTKLYGASLKPKSELLEMQSTNANDIKEVLITKNNLNNNLIELQELLDVQVIEDFDIKPVDISAFEDKYTFTDSDELYTTALKINPLIKSTELNEQINEKQIKINKANYYPRIDFSYSYSTNYFHLQGRDDKVFNQQTNQFEDNGFLVQLDNNRLHFLSINLTIPIFNKFQTVSNIDKSIIELDKTKVELQNQQKELRNKIEIAYNDLLTAKATLDASEISLTSQKEAFTIAQNKYRQGFFTSYEFLESKSKYIQAQSDLIKAKYDYIFRIKVLDYYSH